VASGHGFDFNQGSCTNLLLGNQFNRSDYTNSRFRDIFGGNPFNMAGNVRPDTNSSENTPNHNIRGILEWELATDSSGASKDASGRKGINDVNLALIVMYLNKINHGSFGIVYPVLSQHGSKKAFATYLYNAARNDTAGVGTLLNDTLTTYSNSLSCAPSP
jgi:hypothetical protein